MKLGISEDNDREVALMEVEVDRSVVPTYPITSLTAYNSMATCPPMVAARQYFMDEPTMAMYSITCLSSIISSTLGSRQMEERQFSKSWKRLHQALQTQNIVPLQVNGNRNGASIFQSSECESAHRK